jgi:hypothetical protein
VDGFLIFRAERGKNEATMWVDGRDIREAEELALTAALIRVDPEANTQRGRTSLPHLRV